jgi:hypothetical protein
MALSINDFQAQISASDGFAKQNRFQVFLPTILIGQMSSRISQAQIARGVPSGWDWMGRDWYNGDMSATALELAAYCEKSELPSYQFQLETVRHYGPSFKIPHMPEYQDITMTFMCGSGMWERYFFDAWMYMVMDPFSNDFNYKDEYAMDIDIVQYYDEATSMSGGGLISSEGFVKEGTTYFSTPIVGGNSLSTGRLNTEDYDTMDVDYNYMTTLVDAFPVAINAQELGYDINNSIQKVQVTFSYKFAVPFGGKGSTTGTPARGRQDLFQQTVGIMPKSESPKK